MFFSADKGCRVTGTIVGIAKDVGGIYELEVEDKLKCYAISQPKMSVCAFIVFLLSRVLVKASRLADSPSEEYDEESASLEALGPERF
jgi:hypothetical protein